MGILQALGAFHSISPALRSVVGRGSSAPLLLQLGLIEADDSPQGHLVCRFLKPMASHSEPGF